MSSIWEKKRLYNEEKNVTLMLVKSALDDLYTKIEKLHKEGVTDENFSLICSYIKKKEVLEKILYTFEEQSLTRVQAIISEYII